MNRVPATSLASSDQAPRVIRTNPYREGAPVYWGAGWRGVIPIPHGRKSPPPEGWIGAGAEYPSWPDVQTWLEDDEPRNLALRLPSDILGLDVDDYADKPGAATLAALEAKLGPLPGTWASTSRTEGVSGIRLYRVPEGRRWMGVPGAGIETVAWANRYVMAWPSLHPEGRTYRWVHTGTGEVIAGAPPMGDLPDLPAAWVEALEVTGESAAAPQLRAEEFRAALEALPVGEPCPHIRARMNALRAALEGGTGSRHEAMTRETLAILGKGRRGHPGAREALQELRGPWMEAVTGPGQERDAVKAEHEWTRALAGAVGRVVADHPEQAAPGCDTPYLRDRVGEGAEQMADASDEPWQDPPMLQRDTAEPVPLEGLPPVIRGMVTAAADNAQCSPEIPLVGALGAVAAATRGVFRIKVRDGWTIPASTIYAVALADPGESKTPGLRPLIQPLVELEEELAKERDDENRNRAWERKPHERKLKEATNAEDDEGARREEEKLQELAALPPVNYLQRGGDITTERLTQLAYENRGPVAIVTSEATLFDNAGGRYSDGKGAYGFLNDAYEGEPHHVGRMTRDDVKVTRPVLTLAAAVQPDVMANYGNGKAHGSGFLQRFLWFLPEPMAGYKMSRTPPIPADVSGAYSTAVRAIARRCWGHYRAMTDGLQVTGNIGPAPLIELTPEADELLEELQDQKTERVRALGPRHPTVGWLEKYPEKVARQALLWALVRDPETTKVTGDDMRAALSLAEAQIQHTAAAYGVLRGQGMAAANSPLLEVLDKVSDHVTAAAVAAAVGGKPAAAPMVTTRDIWRVIRGQTTWCHHASDVRDVLEDLADMGWLRGPFHLQNRKGGAKLEAWLVHPSAVHGRGSR